MTPAAKRGAQLLRDLRKPTNPKDALGIARVPFSCIPEIVIAHLALAMYEGARKYGRSNYRVAGVRASVYYDAARRHLADWWEGEDIDVDSLLHHIIKAIASLTVLYDSILTGNWTDDRPPSTAKKGWVKALNKQVEMLQKMYPEAKAPFTRRSPHI